MTGVEPVAVIFGVLIAFAVGSFCCVVIDRLPIELEEPNDYGDRFETRPWGEVVGGHSRCSSCGEPVRIRDNVPILSWLLLRGRCRGCGERIPGFHPIVEALVPLLFLGAVWSIGWEWRLLPVLVLIPAGVVVSAIDLRTLIIPTSVVWPAFLLVVAASVFASGIDGEWAWLLTAIVGLLCLAGPLFIMWFLLPSGMGFGDVRLAVLLGWTVGFYGGVEPLAGLLLSVGVLFAASIIGIAVGVIAMGARGRKAKVPWGPSLVGAALLVIYFAEVILGPFSAWSLS